MSLTLVAVSLEEQPLSQPITAIFDARGGTIGRADHNTMALPDPLRHISRLQAEILAGGEGFRLRNVGANPITVGTRKLGHGDVVPVGEGDAIRIGGYQLKALMTPDEAATPPVPVIERVRAPAPARPGSPLDSTSPSRPPAPPPMTDLLAGVPGVSGSNPFSDLLGPAPSAPAPRPPAPAYEPGQTFADLMPPMQGIAPRSAAVAPVAAPPAAAWPENFDPFAPTAPAPPVDRAAPAFDADNPFADLIPSAPASSVDNDFGLGLGGGDALARFLDEPSSAPPGKDAGRPFDAFGIDAPGPAPAPAMPQQDRLPAVNASFTPPRPARAPTPPAPAPAFAPAPARGSAQGGTDALWRAFCEGAGLSPDATEAAGEESMRKLGRILASAIAGTLQLMAVRGSTKHEFKADVTMIQQHDNNPLKFTPDAVTAIEQLLRPPLRGFLDGPQAMDAAMFDLVGHSIGTVAGLRAAAEGMLGRFAPEALERKLVGNSVLDSLVPMARKARLWELYLQHHEAICEEAQEDFHSLFGKAFVAAYGQQVDRLKREARR